MQEPAQSPPPTPAPPVEPVAPVAPIRIINTTPGATPAAVFEALKAQRSELRNQLETLEDKRRDLSERLQDPMVGGADRKGLEARIADVDQRITLVDKLIGESEMKISQAAAVPGAVQPHREPPREGPPEEVFVLAGIFMVVVLFPLAIAYARRLWKRGVTTIAALPAELGERLTRLEQGMDAVAMEVERIGEGQRYMTRMFAEDGSARALSSGAAEPIEVKAREAEAQYRR